MLYLIAVFAGIGAGLLAGGRLSRILDNRFNKVWVVVAAFVLQIVLQKFHMHADNLHVDNPFTEEAPRLVIILVSYMMLCIGFWCNRRYAGICVIGAGCLMNAAAILVNSGYMPVDYDIAVKAGLGTYIQGSGVLPGGRHIVMTETTRLAFLGDVIHPPSILSAFMKVVSAGDIVIAAGIAILCFELVNGNIIKKNIKNNIMKARG